MKNLFSLLAILCATLNLFASDTDKIKDQHYLESSLSSIPNFIEFSPNEKLNLSDLNAFLESYWGENSNFDLRLKDVFTDQFGAKHYKYVQTYLGYDIEFAELVAHTVEEKITSLSGKLMSETPSFESNLNSEETALNAALNFIGAETYKWEVPEEEVFIKRLENSQEATYYPKGELSYMSPDLDLNPNLLRLCYKFNIYSHEPMGRAEVYVDAINNEIIFRNELIHTANVVGSATTVYSGVRSINTDSISPNQFVLQQTLYGNGINTYNLQRGTSYAAAVDFTDTDNIWNNVNVSLNQYATDAHWGAEQTYDYLFTKFSRNSIDNAGFALNSYIHYSNNFVNAFWNGQVMTYGDGNGTNITPLVALDVAGHEIAHGLTTFSANLIYQRESGALNESFSDIFGASVEHYARPNNANWTIGEDMNFTIRSMSNPNAYNDPDTYGGSFWINQVGCTPNNANDLCGVHINSGVQNYWFYLLVNGGSGTNDLNNAFSVASIGQAKAEAIAYRNLTVYLGRNSDFNEARFYSLRSAIDLYGACSPEMIAVQNAWHAVGVGNSYSPGVIADFTVSDSTSCSVPFTVSFQNNTNNAFNFSWDFGNNTTDSTENPSAVYTASGSYDVTLIADGGACGIDSITKTSFITINRPSAPAVVNDTTCVSQNSTLTASGAGLINWYTQASGGSPVDTGSTISFTQPNNDSTLWVEDAIIAPLQAVGPLNNSIGAGRYFSGSQSLIFDAFDSFILKEVTVYSQSAGTREVVVRDNQGIIVGRKTFNLLAGTYTLQLDFQIPTGTDYEITATTLGSNGPDLYRNNGGVSYPYSIAGIVSINRSTAGNATGFYYYFYDWKVKRLDCVSPRVPITSFKDPSCSITSIQEQSIIDNINIYPIPSKEVLNIAIPSHASNLEIAVYDVNGRFIKEVYNAIESSSSNLLELNMEDLKTGVYLMSIRTNHTQLSKRFVKID